MRKVAFFLSCLFVVNTMAQDLITKKDGEKINAKVLEVGTSEVKYKKTSNPTGPTYTLKVSELSKIKYKNGSEDVFQKTASADYQTFEKIFNFYDGIACVQQNSKLGFIDKSGKLIIPCMYGDILSNKGYSGIVWMEQNSRWGAIDKTGKIVVPFVYESVSYLNNNDLKKVVKDRKCGIVDNTGNLILNTEYYNVSPVNQSLLEIKKDSKIGFFDSSTKKIVQPCIYDNYSSLYNLISTKDTDEKLIRVQQNGKSGIIDQQGNLSASYTLDYDMYGKYSEGLIWVRKGFSTTAKYGFIDKTGRLVIPLIFSDAKDFSEGLAAVQQNGKWGFIDKTGKWVISGTYDKVRNFSEGFAGIRQNGKWGFINKTGNIVVPCIYDYAWDFRYGISVVEDRKVHEAQSYNKYYTPDEDDPNYKYTPTCGLMNKEGKMIAPRIYSEMTLSNGVFKVKQKNVYGQGLVDLSGNLVAPIMYDSIGIFSDGVAVAKKDKKYSYIHKTGKLLAPCIYDDVWDFREDMAMVQENGKYGYISKNGGVAIPCMYNEAYSFSDGLAVVRLNDKYFWIDKTGKCVVNCPE